MNVMINCDFHCDVLSFDFHIFRFSSKFYETCMLRILIFM